MNRRRLKFADFDACLAEVKRLHETGYDKSGNWDLSQICEHLATAFNRSIDGYSFKRPWILRKTAGRAALVYVLRTGQIPAGAAAPPASLPTMGLAEGESIARFEAALRRVDAHAGDFDDHPIFDRLSRANNRRVHLIHAAHHLGFLIPKSTEPAAAS
jgi:hypothetical protein